MKYVKWSRLVFAIGAVLALALTVRPAARRV